MIVAVQLPFVETRDLSTTWSHRSGQIAPLPSSHFSLLTAYRSPAGFIFLIFFFFISFIFHRREAIEKAVVSSALEQALHFSHLLPFLLPHRPALRSSLFCPCSPKPCAIEYLTSGFSSLSLGLFSSVWPPQHPHPSAPPRRRHSTVARRTALRSLSQWSLRRCRRLTRSCFFPVLFPLCAGRFIV